eukprot:symbB.v1.2.039986.t1/scaffold6918.1/size14605/2
MAEVKKTVASQSEKARFAVDLLALLQGDFLQITGVEPLAAACEAAALDVSLEDIAEVITRAHLVGFTDLAKELLLRMAAMLNDAKAARDACALMPQELLVELLALVVERRNDGQQKTSAAPIKFHCET